MEPRDERNWRPQYNARQQVIYNFVPPRILLSLRRCGYNSSFIKMILFNSTWFVLWKGLPNDLHRSISCAIINSDDIATRDIPPEGQVFP